MDLDEVNQDPDLRDNPWGAMTLSRLNPSAPVEYGEEYRVDIEHPVTGKRSMLGVTMVGQAPWNLVCGNRPYEFEHAMRVYARRQAEIQREHESRRKDQRKDFVNALRKFTHRTVDGREALAHYLHGRRR